MTIDAVGGVWRYAVDLARALKDVGIDWVFLGLGPAPSKQQRQEAERIGKLVWHEAPLDWMAGSEDGLSSIADVIMQLAAREGIDLLHLNLPSQAAALDADLPVVAVSHSCVPTWFAAVRGSAPPDGWAWHHAANRRGFDRASVVVAPSRSHAAALERTYGPIADLNVVYNASGQAKRTLEKEADCPRDRTVVGRRQERRGSRRGCRPDAYPDHHDRPGYGAGRRKICRSGTPGTWARYSTGKR
ncbi:glycosyltransferase family 4 protein [Roseibium salinum]|nr:glycosyltransferase family 4 protein [Roseibium salinum]